MKVQLQQIILLCIALLFASQPLQASTISARELGDSLNTYAGFPTCVPRVTVSNLRVNQNTITVRTNKTLSCLSLSRDQVIELRQLVSTWVLGHRNGKVSIYTNGYELGELVTHRMSPRKESDLYTLSARNPLDYKERAWSAANGLDSRTIALWPSHGLYYNRKQNMWHWQRARMWTMVEDLYNYELVHHWLIPMLENAGAYVLEPRAREGYYYQKDSTWLWLGDREAPKDAEVRYMGDGMGCIRRGPDSITSGRPQWMEGARYWLEYCGFPDSIWHINGGKDDYKDDLQCRGQWVNYLSGGSRANPSQNGLGIQVDVCLALHTDGNSAQQDSDIIGTLAIYSTQDRSGKHVFPTQTNRIINRDLADYVQTQLVEDIQKQLCPQWTRRELIDAGYCESRYPIVPTVLLEMLSHKNLADIMLGLEPQFQMVACRAIYKGIGRWMQGDDFVVQPLPVQAPACMQDGSTGCRIRWSATTDSIEETATPDYYIVYTRENDMDWNTGVRTQDTTYAFQATAGIKYDFYVVAGNDGGISLPSETISFYKGDSTRTLIVNNYHRTSGPEWFVDSLRAGIVPGSYPVPHGTIRTYLGDQWIFDKQRDVKENGWTDDDNCGWGMCHMDYVGQELVGNTFDYPARIGARLATDDHSYESCSVDAITASDTTIYNELVIYCGQEKGTLYPQALRELIARHIAAGSSIIIRGKYLGSGMTAPAEKIWAEKTLGYSLRAPKGTNPIGKTNAPDAIELHGEGRVIARFSDTQLPQALQVKKGASTITIISE